MIKSQRLNLNLTQKEVADKLNISVPHYSKIENKKFTNLNISTMINLSEILKLNIHELLEWLLSTNNLYACF